MRLPGELLVQVSQGDVVVQEVGAVQQWLIGTWQPFAGAVAVVLATLVALRVVRVLLGRLLRSERVDTGTQILVRRTISVAVVVLGVFSALGILGVPQSTLFTLLGAAGLALSLAVQDILKNFFSGVYLLLERPFHVGDTIKVKDQTGTVENIGVRTTRLRTLENVQILVPNTIVFAEVVANHTHGPAHPQSVPPVAVPPEQPGPSGQAPARGPG